MTRYNDEQVRALEFCTYCPRLCHFACPSAHGDGSEASTAWGLMSLANHVRKGELEADADLTRQLFHCASCGRCTDFCVHGNDVPSLIRIARAAAVESTGVPEPVAEVLQTLCPSPGARKAPEQHAVVLALGCETRHTMSPETLTALCALLARLLGTEITLAEELGVQCCGDLATRAGDSNRAEQARHTTRHALMNAGLIVTDCDGFSKVCQQDVVSLVDELARHSDAIRVLCADAPALSVVLHGACHARRSLGSESSERALLEAVGVQVASLPAIANNPDCCGGEAVYRAVTPSGATRAARALEIPKGAILVSTSERCAAHLAQAREERVESLLQIVLRRCGACE